MGRADSRAALFHVGVRFLQRMDILLKKGRLKRVGDGDDTMDEGRAADAEGLSDRALLRQYVERRSEAAFSRLVRRHLSLVYATCRREVGDPETAEEVTQAVFLLLARKAPSLRAEAGLAGWLFQTARFAAKNALRREARRQRREWKAAEMMGDAQAVEQEAGEGFWKQVEPFLNDALASLGAADREAVLRRFFEGESLAEIGARLGLSENTARMRVARAVEKMRRHLAREGVPLAGAALAALLSDRAGEAAPASCQAAALHLAPAPGVFAPPPGPAEAHLYQFAQGVWKAMWIKAVTTNAVIAAACLTAVGVPLVIASVPRARPAGASITRNVVRAPAPPAHSAPAPGTHAPAVLTRKPSTLPKTAAWGGAAPLRSRKDFREAAGAGTVPEPVPTLAAALGQAKPPDGGISLAVGAEKVSLLEGNAATHKDASLEQVGFAYGRLLQRFGAVSALAPPTMTVLNADPGQANIYQDMPAADAFTLLTAGLTPGQLQMLTSARGLGLDDLANDYQRGLFLACIPSRTLKVKPRPTLEDQDAPPQGVRDVSGELFQARMRLGQAAGLTVPGKDGMGGGVPKFAAPGAPPVYDYVERNAGLFGQKEVDGVQVRAEVPNTPKTGQLDFKAAAFKVPVPLAGLRTVRDLISRVGGVTRTELYADRRYEGRTLTVAGSPASAPAGDLLRTLALCLAGTYRRVGPAYVLTDDVAGLGTRRRILGEFQQDNAARRREPLQKAENYLEANRTLRDLTLNGFGDPLIPTPQQLEKRDRNTLWAGAIMGVSLPLDQLTPPQQAAVRREADWLEQVRREHPERGAIEVDLNGKITLLAQPSVQLLVPGLDGPIDTDLGQWVAMRFQDTSRFRAPRRTPPTQAALPSPAASGDLATLLKPIPRRAVVAHPQTPSEVDALVARMKRLGLNQLWLDVFSGGVARIPDTPLSPAGQPDLLAEALKATKGTGISVFPTLDLLAWGTKAPPADADLTILGETSAQSEARRVEREIQTAAAEDRDPPAPASERVTVSPLVPDVQRSLLALVRAVATRPGIGGLVWRETTPPGYDPLKNPSARATPRTVLGYNEAARLAFLRREHADPVDIDVRGAGSLAERADTSLPGFDDPAANGLSEKWDEFRAEGETAFLRALYVAARPAGAKTAAAPPRILVQQRRDYEGTAWYGSWDGPKLPFPTRHDPFEDYAGGDFAPQQDEAVQAKAQSQVALLRLPLTGALDTGNIALQCRSALGDIGRYRKWDGFVLELPSGTGIETPPLPKTVKAAPPSHAVLAAAGPAPAPKAH